MKCEKAQELFSEHLEGAMERPMAVAFERHLAECPACDGEYAGFRTTWEMLESLPEVSPRPGFAYDVVMKVREQREAEQRARGWFQRTFGDVFASRVPVRAFAAAAAAVIMGLTLFTPVRDYIGASFGITQAKEAQAPIGTSVEPGMAWLNSGLDFEVDSSTKSGWSVVRLVLKPKDVTMEHASVYIMEPGAPKFGTEDINKARLIFDGAVTDSGQVIPFVLGQSANGSVVTALVRWEHRQRSFAEAVFVPMRMTSSRKHAMGSVEIKDMELYSALREISSAFGAVILVNADINQMVTGISVKDGTVDDALYQVCNSSNLRWRSIAPQVYTIERKIDEVN